MDPIKIVHNFLKNNKLMQIATSTSDDRWIATVWYAADKDMNLYFISNEKRRHSKHIAVNDQVVCAISGSHIEGPGENIQGLQIKGTAHKVRFHEIVTAYKTYSAKWSQLLKLATIEAFHGGTAGTTMYKVIPSEMVLFDQINFPVEPRVEIEL